MNELRILLFFKDNGSDEYLFKVLHQDWVSAASNNKVAEAGNQIWRFQDKERPWCRIALDEAMLKTFTTFGVNWDLLIHSYNQLSSLENIVSGSKKKLWEEVKLLSATTVSEGVDGIWPVFLQKQVGVVFKKNNPVHTTSLRPLKT